MKILHIGDIVGESGRKAVVNALPHVKKKWAPDLIIANGENLAGGFGITEKTIKEIFDAGINVITSGNHIFDKKDVFKIIANEPRLLRPANYPPIVPGNTVATFTTGNGTQCLIFNLVGRIFMDPLDCPFRTADRIIEEYKTKAKVIFIDFHAEATSEKLAFAWYLQGRVSAVIGTHTHVQTSDERILPFGTAYITDAGMTGSVSSVIGVKKEEAIQRFLTFIPHKFEVAKDDVELQGVIVEVDDTTGKGIKIERIKIKIDELNQ